jgi:transcription initiation factor IIE alpha subunit
MKKLIIIVSYMLLFLGLAVAQTGVNSQKETTNTGITYTCSMHPEITSDKPGTCPKCGMDLVQKASIQYTCPMHPEVLSDSPGKCPKCKMDLVVKSSTLYSCPMHPEVTSMEPGKCPKCGMKLKKAKSPEHQMKMGCCM